MSSLVMNDNQLEWGKQVLFGFFWVCGLVSTKKQAS